MLKVFHTGAESDRVEREILAVKTIDSDRIPKIIETGSLSSPLGELLWFIEPLIDGENLKATINQRRLSNKEILILTVQLLEALAAAEEKRIVHRDVKPANIVLDRLGSTWLIDFGIARHLELSSLTPTEFNRGAGTMGYSPPEQFQNKKADIDGRTDLFSAGVVLFECVEGRNPFLEGARSPLDVYRKIERTQLPKISRKIDRTGEFGEFLIALTRKNRSHRPETVKEALKWASELCATERDIEQ